MAFRDLREFIDAAKEMGEVKEFHGAHWDLEIGALTEILAYREPSPLLLFDQIPEYPPTYRVASNLVLHPRRAGVLVQELFYTGKIHRLLRPSVLEVVVTLITDFFVIRSNKGPL